MRVVHQFAPGMSGLIASLPGVTSADHIPKGDQHWNLPLDVDVVFVVHGEGPQRNVDHVPRPAGWPGSVKLVQVASAGLDDYPEWLFEAPRVATCSGTTARPIAEYALAVMLAHVKRLAGVTFKPGDAWPSRDEMMANPSDTLEGRTLGLLGLGQIARQVARYAAAFDMKIIATRNSDTPSPDANVTLVPLEELASRSDHLVIAAPIGAETRGLVGAEFLGRMKPNAHIVNVARGAIIDDDALKAEFDKDRLWASLDVTDPEPLPAGHWLIGHPRARVTPHLSWVSPETSRRVFERLGENIRRVQAGEALIGAVKG
ncbi:dihydrofolate reductase [Polymorphobacter glacialis]|uniref:Dihydrofolate reductase n=1 Tax=Sandarakinorhabdus glacialis TaxID=1614636 RepID=A0A917A2B0_9SPHN|nr:NAD(P)-dependent oxidoreductase [Polymorphobacter glacialis]GGE21946.1 dihydrofolate reductase [Polymorphobacter glacialis]